MKSSWVTSGFRASGIWVFFRHWALKIQRAEGMHGMGQRSRLFGQEQQGRRQGTSGAPLTTNVMFVVQVYQY